MLGTQTGTAALLSEMPPFGCVAVRGPRRGDGPQHRWQWRELGDMLPQYLKKKDYLNEERWQESSRNSEGWHVRYHKLKAFNEVTEAEVRAKMLIYLLENNPIPSAS